MGNACAACEEETDMGLKGGRSLDFKGASNESRGRLHGGAQGGSVHEYSSKPDMTNRNNNGNKNYQGNEDPNKHDPPSYIATGVTTMNPITAPATAAIQKLPRFQDPKTSKNP
jgi:hypothetical protein